MNDREVADYLLATPQFFDRHAELLATIRLSNPHGQSAVSLQQRQMDMLRDKNKQLERRLAELVRYGHENDGISSRFTRWTARILAQRDPHALPDTIATGLRETFDVPHAALRVWDVADAYALADFARSVGEEVKIFANSLATPYCGANTGFEAAQWLGASASPEAAAPGADGDANAPITSLALMALRDPNGGDDANAFGLLVIGSPDPRRFHEGMSTDFLARIGTLASAALSRLLAH
jgi:uncharacterized protein YigA (DUF484 family)